MKEISENLCGGNNFWFRASYRAINGRVFGNSLSVVCFLICP